jgi:hypothetical protein
MEFVDFRTCSLVHRVRDQNARRITALDRYIDGWAEANVEKIFNATAPSYRFSDPLVGTFYGTSLDKYFDILQYRVSQVGPVAKDELYFFLRGPLEGRSNDNDLRFWREAPRIGLTGVAEVEVGERGVIAERIAYDGNLASDMLYRTAHSSIGYKLKFSSCSG